MYIYYTHINMHQLIYSWSKKISLFELCSALLHRIKLPTL